MQQTKKFLRLQFHTHLSSKHNVPTMKRKSVLVTNLVWTKAAQNHHFLKLAKFLVPVSW